MENRGFKTRVKEKVRKKKSGGNEKSLDEWRTTHDLVRINSIGEGGINVCGENGDIYPGDLIVTSNTPGKGMKQADDVVRNYTVAKARGLATFKNPNDTQMVACIYLCG